MIHRPKITALPACQIAKDVYRGINAGMMIKGNPVANRERKPSLTITAGGDSPCWK